jgi:hypothetical protein
MKPDDSRGRRSAAKLLAAAVTSITLTGCTTPVPLTYESSAELPADRRPDDRAATPQMTPPGPVEVPFRLEGFYPVVQGTVEGTHAQGPVDLQLVLSTGGDFEVRLSRAAAAKTGVWLSAETSTAGPGTHNGEPATGVARSLRVGGLTRAPIAVRVPAENGGPPGVVGMRALEPLGGVVFDWQRRVVTFLPRSGSAGGPRGAAWPQAQSDAWANLPWTRSAPGAPRTVEVRIGEQPFRAMLDTGVDVDMVAYTDIPRMRSEGRSLRYTGQAFPRAFLMQIRRPLHLGPLLYETVYVFSPRGGGGDRPEGERAGADFVLGASVLSRQPAVWFDMESDMVRLWTGGVEVPRFVGAGPQTTR